MREKNRTKYQTAAMVFVYATHKSARRKNRTREEMWSHRRRKNGWRRPCDVLMSTVMLHGGVGIRGQAARK